MHDNIMIDKLMSWLMMIEEISHLEGETLHEIPTLIIIWSKSIEDSWLLKKGFWTNDHLRLLKEEVLANFDTSRENLS